MTRRLSQKSKKEVERRLVSEKLHISNQAIEDLEDIWIYTAEDSVTRADDFIDRLYSKCVELSELKGVGRSREELLPGLKSFPYKGYVIFFYRTELGVDISRILNAARDIDQVFGE